MYGTSVLLHLSWSYLASPNLALDMHVLTLQSLDVQETVRQVVEGVLGECPAPDAPLMAAGLDSLGATELQQGLNQTLDLDLPATLAFDHPTMDAICGLACERMQGSSGLIVPQQALVQDTSRSGSQGMAALWGSAGAQIAQWVSTATSHPSRHLFIAVQPACSSVKEV